MNSKTEPMPSNPPSILPESTCCRTAAADSERPLIACSLPAAMARLTIGVLLLLAAVSSAFLAPAGRSSVAVARASVLRRQAIVDDVNAAMKQAMKDKVSAVA